ncbi:MAG TPA: MBL fold metallo-hydrolase [Patescibacteria group bacterium]|nr:MBL fold metallo-hydrolase [Patescibacteria group bacterium]
MKVTKYLHSCLLVEENNKTILIDPVNFTYEAKVLDIAKIEHLDYLLFTHEHPDHFYLPFVQEILEKFPTVEIFTNDALVTVLEKDGIKATTDGNEFIKLTPVHHERVFDREAPQNILFELFDRLADPGDSMSFTTDKDILALPLLGPSWMITQAVEKALEVKPKIVLPIHDWHWRDDMRKQFYQRLTDFFSKHAIDFKPLETGASVTL